MIAVFSAAMLITVAAASGVESAQDAAAKRFVAALQGTVAFEPTDYVKPLGEKEKAYFARFAKCKVRYVIRPTTSTPEKPNVFVQVPDYILVELACRGVPDDTPVGLSLHYVGSKIGQIEMHNADLMRVE